MRPLNNYTKHAHQIYDTYKNMQLPVINIVHLHKKNKKFMYGYLFNMHPIQFNESSFKLNTVFFVRCP